MLLLGATPCPKTEYSKTEPRWMKCTALARAEERTQLAIWAIVASPLLMSTDVAKVPAASKADLLNMEVLAVNHDRLGRQGWRVRHEGLLQVWVRPLFDGAVAVALHNGNNGSISSTVEASLAEVGFGEMTAVAVRDLFAKKALAPIAADGAVSATVELARDVLKSHLDAPYRILY